MTDPRLSLLKSHFLARTDILAFAPPWKAPVHPCQVNGNLDAILLAHLTGEAATYHFEISEKDDAGQKTGNKLPRKKIGAYRLGSYTLSGENLCRWVCWDFDGAGGEKSHAHALENPFREAYALYEAGEKAGLPIYLEKSGGGGGWHGWLFFAEPVPAEDARALGILLAPPAPRLLSGEYGDPRAGRGIEVFPKQAKAKRVGNMVWLPWFYGAKEGCNVFYDPESGVPYPEGLPPEGFSFADPEAVSALLPEARKKTNKKSTEPPPVSGSAPAGDADDLDPYVRRAFEAEVSRVLLAGKGEARPKLAYGAAKSLGRFVVSGQLTREQIAEALLRASHANGACGEYGVEDIERQIGNGLDDGEAKEREKRAEGGTWVEGPGQGTTSPGEGETEGKKKAKKSAATILVELALNSGAEFWKSPEQDTYVSVPVGNHVENYPLHSRAARRWLAGLVFEARGMGVGNTTVQDAINTLDCVAIRGKIYQVYVRLAEYGEKYYLDLGDDSWGGVEIDSVGWRLCQELPVKFLRPRGLLPLPAPVGGGEIDELRDLINAPDDNLWVFIVAWLVASLRPHGPFPILILCGEQGSTKSTTTSILRRLVDPHILPLREPPKNSQDLAIAANNGWIMAYDNFSHIPEWLSDCLCRLSTGGGFATRKLYTDNEESLFFAKRPLILNGIDYLAVRGDLADRAINLWLPRVTEQARQQEDKVWARFERKAPAILGALLDAVSEGLRNLPNVKLEKLPRLADFAAWITACEPALPWEPGTFMELYEEARKEGASAVLEEEPVSSVLQELLRINGEWEGTPSQLLSEINAQADEAIQRRRGWPRTSSVLGSKLRRIAPALRQSGFEVEFDRNKSDRIIRFKKASDSSD